MKSILRFTLAFDSQDNTMYAGRYIRLFLCTKSPDDIFTMYSKRIIKPRTCYQILHNIYKRFWYSISKILVLLCCDWKNESDKRKMFSIILSVVAENQCLNAIHACCKYVVIHIHYTHLLRRFWQPHTHTIRKTTHFCGVCGEMCCVL